MTKYQLSLLATLCLATAACSDDGGNNTPQPDSDAAVSTSAGEATTASPAPTSASDESTTQREGPWGCYLEDHHKCDCSIKSEDDCDGVGLWVEGCATCSATDEDAGDTVDEFPGDSGFFPDASTPDADTSAGFGCYDPAEHGCTCGGTQSECTDGGIWTSECGCAAESDAAVDTSSSPVEAGASSTGVDAASSVSSAAPETSATSAVDDGGALPHPPFDASPEAPFRLMQPPAQPAVVL